MAPCASAKSKDTSTGQIYIDRLRNLLALRAQYVHRLRAKAVEDCIIMRYRAASFVPHFCISTPRENLYLCCIGDGKLEHFEAHFLGDAPECWEACCGAELLLKTVDYGVGGVRDLGDVRHPVMLSYARKLCRILERYDDKLRQLIAEASKKGVSITLLDRGIDIYELIRPGEAKLYVMSHPVTGKWLIYDPPCGTCGNSLNPPGNG